MAAMFPGMVVMIHGMVVVWKLEYDAKSRGRSVHIGQPKKVISQKKTQTQKLIYMKKAGG